MPRAGVKRGAGDSMVSLIGDPAEGVDGVGECTACTTRPREAGTIRFRELRLRVIDSRSRRRDSDALGAGLIVALTMASTHDRILEDSAALLPALGTGEAR